MNIESSFIVPAPQADAWLVLNDIGLVGSCIPGCEGVERVSQTSYRAVMKTEIGIIKARFNLVIEITRTEAPRALFFTCRGEEGSRASILQSENSVVLDALGLRETRINVTSDVAVTGRLGKFGLGVMKKKSEAMTREFAESLRAKVSDAEKALPASSTMGEIAPAALSPSVPAKDRSAVASPGAGDSEVVGPASGAPGDVAAVASSSSPRDQVERGASSWWPRLNDSLRRHRWWTSLRQLLHRH